MTPDPIAIAQADALETELDQNRRMMADCPECGKRPALAYEPGRTRGGCCNRGFVAADWEMVRIRNEWNAYATRRR